MKNFKDKDKVFILAALVTQQEKDAFKTHAQKISISGSALARRLVNHLINSKMSVDTLLKEYNALPKPTTPDKNKVLLRSVFSAEEAARLTKLANNWGTSPSSLLKRLYAVYVAGRIDPGEIWR